MASGVRWKSKEKAAVALEEPISSLYKAMQEWEPLEALLVHTSVVLTIDISKAQIFSRACFGVRREVAMASHNSASAASARSSRLLEEIDEPEASVMWQLGMEEAFFLASHLGCISIYRHGRQGRETMCKEEVWRCMQFSNPDFGYLYIVCAHLRAKHWVVRSGIQYGAHFMAYRHHPEFVHSDYSVIVMVEGQEERMKTWTEVAGNNRLCRSVAKTQLLFHIIPKCEEIDMSSPSCQEAFTVEAVEVRRWLPEKNREESDQTILPSSDQAST
ncbi:hypothetical protein KC19_VG056000 [Ceratodon purpureus]|uniref:tRNA-intron lyase n=1 Tax=Ceratodon purpureus TaxID=3225 RepID=A0A8T0HMC4_CERPU|nr:hypothetical protein KC19_VG056000 [Ceratodon purpureus]